MHLTLSSDSQEVGGKERLEALGFLPPFLRLVLKCHPQYVGMIVLLRLIRALLPLALLWVSKLIIEVVEQYAAGVSVDWKHLGVLIGLELTLAIGTDVLAKISALFEELLGDMFDNTMSLRLMRHASRLDLAHFENPSTYDRLRRVRDRTPSTVGVFFRLLDTAQALVTLTSLIAALALFVPWLLVLLGVAVIPVFFGETHFANRGYSLLLKWTPQRRRLDYLRFVAASDKTAKEVKLFGLEEYLVNRYETLAWRFYEASKRLLFLKIEPIVTTMPGAHKLPPAIEEGFVFDSVGFRYPGTNEWAIRNLTLHIPPRQAIALVGENGAGKTTIIKLLVRLYDPEEGHVFLDGRDLREYEVEDLRRQISVIFQDFVRYAFLFRENIGVGDVARIDDYERINDAAHHSLASGVARRLERGFDQQLGREFEGGVELSGGEWQKVALARAYVREAQVVVLDEPTAALDARGEYDVFRRVTELAQDKITLIISHRFSTVRVADRIVVLKRGRLVEQGTHESLLSLGGEYAELFNLQAAGYR